MATCVELAGTRYPQTYKGHTIIPAAGESLLPVLQGKGNKDRYLYAEHEGNRMVRHGDWKLVAANYKKDVWELYNIKDDRTEQHDLAALHPEKVKALEAAYFNWADKSDGCISRPLE